MSFQLTRDVVATSVLLDGRTAFLVRTLLRQTLDCLFTCFVFLPALIAVLLNTDAVLVFLAGLIVIMQPFVHNAKTLKTPNTDELITHLFGNMNLPGRATLGPAPAKVWIRAEHVTGLDDIVTLKHVLTGVGFDLFVCEPDPARPSGTLDLLPAVRLQPRAEPSRVAVRADFSVVSAGS